MNNNIAIFYPDKTLVHIADKISLKYALDITGSKHRYPFLLVIDWLETIPGYKLSLLDQSKPGIKPVSIDFNTPQTQYRTKFGGGLKQGLAKAIGVTGKPGLAVLDMTAGLGRDAFILASLGCKVTMLEINGALAAILENALERGAQQTSIAETISNLKLVHIDSCEYLQKKTDIASFSVIYIDPMYPQRHKSAKVKKDLALLQRYLANTQQPGVSELLQSACGQSIKRIVLKRPVTAKIVGNPVGCVESKTTRFDIYHG